MALFLLLGIYPVLGWVAFGIEYDGPGWRWVPSAVLYGLEEGFPFLVLAAAWPVFHRRGLPWLRDRRRSMLARACGWRESDPVVVAWDSAGVRRSTPHTDSRLDWSQYAHVWETPTGLALVPRYQPFPLARMVLFVPASASPVPMAELVSEARRYVDAAA